jgi:hypothetical protein
MWDSSRSFILGHEEDGDDTRPTNETEELELAAIIKEDV